MMRGALPFLGLEFDSGPSLCICGLWEGDFPAARLFFAQEGIVLSLIQIEHLTFAHEGSYDNVFEDVSLQLDSRWKLGLIGRNGCGKTTFLHLLQGKHDYQGRISASVEFVYFPYSMSDVEATAGDVAAKLLEEGAEWRLYRELSLLEVPEAVLERPFATLSGGEQTKLLLAALFSGEDRFLLIDEPTNHLDLLGRESVARYLKGKRSFILVSHDREFLDDCVDHVMNIGKTQITVQKGNYTTWQREKDARDHLELEQNRQLKKDIRRLEAAARQAAGWSDKVEKSKRRSGSAPSKGGPASLDKGFIGHKAAKMMQRSKSIQKRQEAAITEKEGLLRELETSEPLKLHPLEPPQKTLVRLEQVTIAYDPGVPVCENVSFTVPAGGRVAIQGRNGSGKSSLLKLICGEVVPFTGTLWKCGGLRISYAGQDASRLSGSLRDYAVREGIDLSLFQAILRKLGFARVQFEKDLAELSAGQKKKILLSGSLCQQAHLYIWDEPLNYIDLMSRIQIENLLLKAGGTMLFVEHDQVFCQKIATETVVL